MFSKKELNNIKKKLPKGAYKTIAEKLGGGISAASVKMIFNYPERYRKEVFDMATIVVKEHKLQVAKEKAAFKKAIK
jgi:hypothetical protein